MEDAARRELLDLFGDRAILDESELHLYDHDHLVIPDNVRDKIDHVPDAVVKPTSTEEVRDVVEFALLHDLPVVPRGAASERYGGATPTKGGIVVDTTLMDDVVDVDGDVARVQAGISFRQLEESLADEGKMPTVRSTADPATVGGFAAHGGVGIGSLQFGAFPSTVEAVEVVTPEGEVREVSGKDLDLYLGTHGGCGILTELTVDVQDEADIQPVLVRFPDVQSVHDALIEHQLYTVPIWSAHVISPDHAEIVEEATGSSPVPADGWYVLFLFRNTEWAGTFETQVHREYNIQEVFWEAVELHGGEEAPGSAEAAYEALGDELAYAKLGPGFVATDGRVPIKKLHTFVERSHDRVPGDLKAVTGTLVGSRDTTGPTDRRDVDAVVTVHLADDIGRPDYDLAAGSSFGVADAALSVGGRPHATGLIFSHLADEVYGKRLPRIRRYKDAKDPGDLMNPGKLKSIRVRGPGGIPMKLTTLNKLGEPIAALSAPFIGYEGPDEEYISELAVADVMRADASETWDPVAWDLNACTQCGYCIDFCEVLDPIRWESSGTRGKMYLLRKNATGEVDLGRAQTRHLHQCTECGYCDEVCPVDFTPTKIHRYAKRNLDARPDGYEAIRDHIEETGNPFGAPADDRSEWVPDDTPDEGDVLFHAGCAAAYHASEATTRSFGVLRQLGYDPVTLDDEVCAGGPLATGGWPKAFADHAEQVIRDINERGIETVICLGAEEAKTFAEDYPDVAERRGLDWDVDVKTFEEVVVECQDRGQLEAIPDEDDDEEEEESSARARARGRGGDDGESVLTYAPPQLTRVLDMDNGSKAVLDDADGLDPVEADLRYGVGIGGNVPDWFPDLARQRAEEFFDREADRADRLVVGDAETFHHLREMAEELGPDVEVEHLAEVVLERFELSEPTDQEEGEVAEEDEEIDLSHLPPKERAIKRAQIIAERKG